MAAFRIIYDASSGLARKQNERKGKQKSRRVIRTIIRENKICFYSHRLINTKNEKGVQTSRIFLSSLILFDKQKQRH